MMIEKNLIQCRRDRSLRESLMTDSGVKLAQRKVDEHTSGYGFYGRRRLLAGALRVKRNMLPSLADALQQCRDLLGVQEPLELYIKPDADYGAFVMKSPAGPWALGVTSSLVEKFSPAELRFVISQRANLHQGHGAGNKQALQQAECIPAIHACYQNHCACKTEGVHVFRFVSCPPEGPTQAVQVQEKSLQRHAGGH